MTVILKILEHQYIHDHLDEINKIINKTFPDYNIEKFVKPDYMFFEIRYNNEFAGLFNIYDHNRIQKFFIIPELRGKGVGTEASKVIKRIIRAQNIPLQNLHCYVKKNNLGAINFWKKNGFEITLREGDIVKMNCLEL